MALTGPEGETHSHLGRTSADSQPTVDRGHWVGPRGGRHTTAAEEWANRNGLPLDRPVSTAGNITYAQPAVSIGSLYRGIGDLIETKPMIERQRIVLKQALAVLAELEI